MPFSLTRKNFLTTLTAIAANACLSIRGRKAMAKDQGDPVATDSATDRATEAFSDRVFDDSARMLCGALSYVGDRLGLFKALSDLGACTPSQLAKATNCNERLLLEWCKAMRAYEYIEYMPQTGRFRLSRAQTAVLANEDSPAYMGGMLQCTVPQVMATQVVMNSLQSGTPLLPSVFHADLWEGIDRANATVYQHQLVQEWLPLASGVTEKLTAGGKAVDVGCGQGNAVIILAKSFPKSKFVGYDPYRPSIEKAQQAAKVAGVDDRTSFFVGGAEDLPARQFDLATSFLTMHHMSHPVRDLSEIRRSLNSSGCYLIREDNLSNDLEANSTPIARLAYSSSVMACLHDSMANEGAALGPLPETRIAGLVKRAGFVNFRRLAIASPYDAVYEARN